MHIISFFFFNDTATTEIYTLSLHDALPIWRMARGSRRCSRGSLRPPPCRPWERRRLGGTVRSDRKSTRLNSSHGYISYAVFCLKKKTNSTDTHSYYALSHDAPSMHPCRYLQ